MAGFGVRLRRFLSGKNRGSNVPVWQARRQPGVPESFADDNNDFALAMYGQLREQQGNVFSSPFSIRTALGMAQAGAKGETAAQIGQALRSSASDEETLHVALAAIIQRLNAAGDGNYEMAVANSLWGQEGGSLQSEFLDVMTRHYRGGLHRVDFRRGPDGARAAINRWVEDRTKKKIRELIPAGGLDADTRLVLVNAVYFKGTWLLQFRRAATRDEPFRLEAGGTVQTPLMHQQEEVRHVQADGYQAVDLLYEGGDLSMLVLLPDRKDGLRDLENRLSARMLRDCVTQMAVREVKLFLPRFKITWGTVNVCRQLAAIGITLAFNRSQADFSGINGYKAPHEEALFISAVYHKAFVEVTEEGTEAAAATATAITLGAALVTRKPPPVPVFRADHPFLFAIRDRNSGAILFLGRMADPTKGS
jgi:serpin B